MIMLALLEARLPGLVPTITIIILHPNGCFIGIGGGGGGNRGVYSRRRSSLDVDGGVLVRLIFVIRITEDDDFTITGRPECHG
jgi:hypothetical protein